MWDPSRWRSVAVIGLLATLFVICSCGQDRIHEGDDLANFERIFDAPPPSGVDVVHSVLQEYRWRLGVVTTDDWEIELIAPRSWIDEQIERMHLAPLAERDHVAKLVRDRQAKRFRPWYVPQALESYDGFYLKPTSIPYVHMLVEKEPQVDGRYRVFMSKH
jgi:hypothetical protein